MRKRNSYIRFLLISAAVIFSAYSNGAIAQTPFEEGNLLTAIQNPNTNLNGLGELREYDLTGNVLQTIEIPTAFGLVGSQVIAGIDADDQGRAVVHQTIGDSVRIISTYDSTVGIWSHQPFGNITSSGGGSAISGDEIFVSNNRFNVETGSITTFTATEDFGAFQEQRVLSDVAVGQDGLLYGLRGLSPNSELFIFDLVTLEQIADIELSFTQVGLSGIPSPSRENSVGVAVNESGRIFSVNQDGFIRAFDRNGQAVDEFLPFGFGTVPGDIELSSDGTIAVTSFTSDSETGRRIILTDESLETATFFDLEDIDRFSSRELEITFATAVPTAVPEPASWLVLVVCGLVTTTTRRRSCR